MNHLKTLSWSAGALLCFALLGSSALAGDALTPSRAVGGTHECNGFYPELSRSRGVHGNVLVGYDVDAEGNIVHVHVVGSSGDQALDDAAVACVATHWRNTPAMRGSTPVASPGHRAIIQFLLRDDAPPSARPAPYRIPPAVFTAIHPEEIQRSLLVGIEYLAGVLAACGALAFLNWLIFRLRRG